VQPLSQRTVDEKALYVCAGARVQAAGRDQTYNFGPSRSFGRAAAPIGPRRDSSAISSTNVEDTLTFSRFQTFNFDGWDKYPDVLEPMLFYVLQRGGYGGRGPENAALFKIFVIDEGWIFFKKPIIASGLCGRRRRGARKMLR